MRARIRELYLLKSTCVLDTKAIADYIAEFAESFG
jgi:hypothetical protein